jgi:transcriptional regulator with XRE-family HTH domain
MLSDRLRLALEQSGLSQAELARRIGVTPGAVSLWLSGETKALKASNAVLLAKHLGVSPEWLATGRGPMRPDASAPMEPGEELVPIERVRLKLEAEPSHEARRPQNARWIVYKAARMQNAQDFCLKIGQGIERID